MKPFSAEIGIIGINPYVLLPRSILHSLFKAAGKDRGQIPVKGTVDGHAYTKFLVRYQGEWRLYLNGITRRAAGKEVGDRVKVTVEFDGTERATLMPAGLKKALKENRKANSVFLSLSPSHRKEIQRYINNLKSPEAALRNTSRAIRYLLGEERFVGRPPVGVR